MKNRIILISASPEHEEYITKILDANDCTLHVYKNIHEAMSVLSPEYNISVIVIDTSLPDINSLVLEFKTKAPEVKKVYIADSYHMIAHAPWNQAQSYLQLVLNPVEEKALQAEVLKALEFSHLINQNKRFIETLTLKNVELKKVKNRYEDFIEQEKLRISQELHDETSQSLAYLTIKLEVLQKLADSAKIDKNKVLEEILTIRSHLKTIMSQIRRISLDLRPKSLDTLGFLQSVQDHLKIFEEKYSVNGLKVALSVEGDVFTFDSKTELMLFRVIQEALNNIAKHAHAHSIMVDLIYLKERSLKIRITDDGHGFVTGKSDENLLQENHMGLISMKERVESIYGEFNIQSEVGVGTVINILIPIL